MSPIPITPAPAAAPIIGGLQFQSPGESRGYRPAGTSDWLLVVTLSGQGYVRAAGALKVLEGGDMLLIRPDTPQEYGHLDDDSGWVNVWTHFRPRAEWLDWLRWPELAPGIMVLAAGDALERMEFELRHMVEVANGALRLRLAAAMNSLERVLILADAINPLQAVARRDPRIRKAVDLIGERLSEPIEIAALAEVVGLSRSRFTVLFTAELGVAPQAYIEAERLARAAHLLRSSSWRITQVALHCGFANPFYFTTRFRRRYGMPPGRFRLSGG
jgi:AraC family transcriptional regulator of arabinose operon